jgi:hypothetical protein
LNYKEKAVNLNRSPFFERFLTSVCVSATRVRCLCLFKLLQISWDKFGTRRIEKIGGLSGKLRMKILENQQLKKNESGSLSLRRESFYPLNYGGSEPDFRLTC